MEIRKVAIVVMLVFIAGIILGKKSVDTDAIYKKAKAEFWNGYSERCKHDYEFNRDSDLRIKKRWVDTYRSKLDSCTRVSDSDNCTYVIKFVFKGSLPPGVE